MFKCSSKLARNTQQLKFLRTCKSENIFPKTIENLHLPGMFKSNDMSSYVRRIKMNILSKMIRNLYREKHQTAENLYSFNDKVRLKIPEFANIIINFSKNIFMKTKLSHFYKMKKKFLILAKNLSSNDSSIKTEKVTDMTGSLTNDEITLLAKGPKFAIKTEANEQCKLNITTSFCRLAYQLRWMNKSIENEPDPGNQNTIPAIRHSSNINKPKIDNPELENKLKLAFNDIQKLLRSTEFSNCKSNLSKDDLKALKRLKNRPYTYLPSDKGGEFCIIQTTEYDKAAHKHLEDSSIYQKVPRMKTNTIEKKVNSVWKKVHNEANIPHKFLRLYTTTNSRMPVFYHLIKTHKKSSEIKIRPIVSNSNGPTYKLSWLLNEVLKPLLKNVPAHLENSNELIEQIKNTPAEELKKHNFPFSLDVVALYTSIPTQDAIDDISAKLHDDPNICKPFKPQNIIDLLLTILSNTYFEYKGQVYRQISGLPMGSNISGLIAISFMGTLETQALRFNQNISIYRRYVDDTCIITTNKQEAERIFQCLNNQNSNIKFEIEYPTAENSLALLDFKFQISEDGQVTFDFYQKMAKKAIFPHKQSAIPDRMKYNIAHNELNRRITRCTHESAKQNQKEQFQELLRSNGYTDLDIKKALAHKKRTKKDSKEKVAYFNCPYISETFDKKLRKIFNTHKLPVRLYRRSRTLRSALNKRNLRQSCSLEKCKLNNNLCYLKNCVYSMKCNKCHKEYIGSSKRDLHKRYNEHLSNPNSSIFKHLSICGNDFTTSILSRDPDEINLRFKEAIMIAQRTPALNSKMEREELLYLIFHS